MTGWSSLLLVGGAKYAASSPGPRHMGTAIAQTQLGRVARLAGNLQQARGILEAALETKQSIHGSEHPSECPLGGPRI